MDQNTVTLLSTLLGGFLSVGGGFLANYLTQAGARREDKQKAIRNMIEKVYKNIDCVDNNFKDIKETIEISRSDIWAKGHKANLDEAIAKLYKTISTIEGALVDMELVVTLYLTSLQDPFRIYRTDIYPFLDSLVFKNGVSDREIDMEEINNVGRIFKQSLAGGCKILCVSSHNKRSG